MKVEPQSLLDEQGVRAEVFSREKRPYSIWRKMMAKNVTFDDLADIFAFRIIVATPDECYRTLGLKQLRAGLEAVQLGGDLGDLVTRNFRAGQGACAGAQPVLVGAEIGLALAQGGHVGLHLFAQAFEMRGFEAGGFLGGAEGRCRAHGGECDAKIADWVSSAPEARRAFTRGLPPPPALTKIWRQK